MFYSPDLLKKQDQSFSVIWCSLTPYSASSRSNAGIAGSRLAATLGSKSSFKKLQKRDILSVNVPKACIFLSDPKEPLALRLSSNLMYGVTRIYSQQYNFLFADVTVVHAKIRKEAMSPRSISLEAESRQTPFPEKEKSTLARTTNLTIPDSDTFVPEFGINIPPHLALQFRSLLADDNPANEEKEPTPPGPNLSSPLGTPLPHNPDFSLHGYDIGGGSSFSIDYDDDGGFGYAGGYDDDDDVLRHANDAGTLDFNLEIPGSSTKKRGANDEGGSGKRARYHSIDDEDVRRIAREDHAGGGQFDFALSGGIEFGDDPQFDPYHTPSPISPENGPEKAGQVVPTLPLIKKRRRALIVQDSVTVNTDSPRAWQDRYAEKMHGAKARWEKAERAKVAAARAMDALWRWNGTTELHPLLATFFSRDALLKRWDQSPSEVKRKWDATIGGGDIEIGMDSGGFGDGGFGDMPGIPDSLDLTEMEIGRHAPSTEPGHASIQSLQMPWQNISSRPTSRQPSQDPQRPRSIDGLGLRSSVSRGFFDDVADFGYPSSPVQGRVRRSQVGTQGTFNSQREREMVEKDSTEFFQFLRQFLEDAHVVSVSLQEMLPTDSSPRPVLANALYNTCCTPTSGLGN